MDKGRIVYDGESAALRADPEYLARLIGVASRRSGAQRNLGIAVARASRYGHNIGMATPTIKSTYVMDVGTVRALERIARRWKVSKSEALRRAIHASAEQQQPEVGDPLQALDQLQLSLKLTPSRARAWAQAVRVERRAASARSEARGA
jgi:hypothetical protein